MSSQIDTRSPSPQLPTRRLGSVLTSERGLTSSFRPAPETPSATHHGIPLVSRSNWNFSTPPKLSSTHPRKIFKTTAASPTTPQSNDENFFASSPSSRYYTPMGGSSPFKTASKVPPIRDTKPLLDVLRDTDTAISARTMDLEALALHSDRIQATVLDPRAILRETEYKDASRAYLLWVAIRRVLESESGALADILVSATDQLFVELGVAMMDRTRHDAPHFTFVDPLLGNDANAMISRACSLIERFGRCGVKKQRLVISVPATEAGIYAASVIRKAYDIQTNLILVNNVVQAAFCAEAQPTTVTIHAGTLFHLHQGWLNKTYDSLSPHPVVETIQTIVAYYTLHRLDIKVIAGSLSGLEETEALMSLDALSLGEKGLSDLDTARHSRTRAKLKADPEAVALRARQVQYPTTFLSNSAAPPLLSNTGEKRAKLPYGSFAPFLAPNTRRVMRETLELELNWMQDEMREIYDIVQTELERELALRSTSCDWLEEAMWTRAKRATPTSKSTGGIDAPFPSSVLSLDAPQRGVDDSDEQIWMEKTLKKTLPRHAETSMNSSNGPREDAEDDVFVLRPVEYL